MKERHTLEELAGLYPDRWVILDDCEWENQGTIKNGILVGVCDDKDISKTRMKYRHEGKRYMYRRTTEGLVSPYVHAINYEVTT